jgi:16S rRNA (guanine527-N7)-methyltransferase
VGSTEPAWLVENVILDSLCFARLLPPEAVSVADLGSGSGVPGVPLKIVRPELKVTLIESRERRASFLAAVIRELELRDCDVFGGRAENVDPAQRNYDVVVMRCAGDLARMIPVAAGLARPGGVVIASGPPKRPAISMGVGVDWVDVQGVRTSRLFALYRKPAR